MIVRDGDRFRVQGPLTLRSAGALLARGQQLFVQPVSRVDLAAVTEVDSAAVALAITWLREARAGGRTIRFENLPPAMAKLARLYAVADLIPGA